MYQTLYRKWRPKTFDGVYGQNHVTSILKYQVSHSTTSHAYLFCGSRGTGKTTCAKILARAMNCENPQNGSPCGKCPSCLGIESGKIVDVIEMDAASNNGVNDIRNIREDVAYAPTELKKRVFIIDEVHMLSIEAFNALLKTLEEPPEHIVFILATTELQQIPATILSRCQRFDFRRIDASVIVGHLKEIADAEKISISEEALYLIAKTAKGGMRDAIGMLELCASGSGDGATPLTEAQAAELIGTTDTETLLALTDAILTSQYETIFMIIHNLYRSSKDITFFWESLSEMYRDFLVIKTATSPRSFFDLPDKTYEALFQTAQRFSKETLLYHCTLIDQTLYQLQKNSSSARTSAEMALVRLCDARLDVSPQALLSRISKLEEAIVLGVPTQQHPLPKKELPVVAPKGEVSPPPAPPKAAPSEPSRKELRSFGGWSEVIEKLSAENAMLASFLPSVKAYECVADGTFHLIASDEFIYRMLDTEEHRSALINAVNLRIGERKFKEDTFFMECQQSKEVSGYELMDELMDELQQENSEN